jgi:hypothetical protein
MIVLLVEKTTDLSGYSKGLLQEWKSYLKYILHWGRRGYVNLTNYPLTYMINYEKITPTVHVAANKTVLLSCPKNG